MTGAGNAEMRSLYDWLGKQARQAKEAANKPGTRDGDCLRLSYAAETLCDVRAHMRETDPALPIQAIDDETC